jgi:hypothetical protein
MNHQGKVSLLLCIYCNSIEIYFDYFNTSFIGIFMSSAGKAAARIGSDIYAEVESILLPEIKDIPHYKLFHVSFQNQILPILKMESIANLKGI